jgi:TonB family protein
MRFTVIGIAACLASAPVAAQESNTPVRAGALGVSHPRIVEAGPPVFPPIALAARVQGNVVIEAVIDMTGRVTGATITKSIPLLDVAAIGAVRRWQFEPPIAGGRAILFATTITLQFELFDEIVPSPISGARVSGSGMPADFAVVYAPSCPIVAILVPATHNLEAVYRAFSTAGLLAQTAGLRVWEDPATPRATIANNGVEMTIAGQAARVDCSGSPPRLDVRSGGTWRRLLSPSNRSPLPPDYEKQLGPAIALLKQMVDSK